MSDIETRNNALAYQHFRLIRKKSGRTGRAAAGVAAVALAAGGLLAGVAGSAQAITGRSLVTVTSGASSADKSVTATCPAGKKVVGAGGEVLDGAGRVLLTDVIPDASLNSVTTTGGENGAFAGAWQIRAQAMCAPAGSIANLQRVPANASNNGTSDFSKSAVASCPPGLRLYGDGYQTSGADGNVTAETIEPDTGLTQVSTLAYEANAYGLPWDWTAYAICGTGQATMTRVFDTSTLDSDPAHGILTSPCPAGTTLTGAGAFSEEIGAVGNIHRDRMSLEWGTEQAGVNAWEDPVTGYPSDWDEQAFSICVS
jgi:hypothetical protein